MDSGFAFVVFVFVTSILLLAIALPVLIISRVARAIRNSVAKLFRRTAKV